MYICLVSGGGGAMDFDAQFLKRLTPNQQIGEAPEVQVARLLFIAIF